MLSILNSLLIAAILLILLACSDNDVHDHPADITAKQLYEIHCAGCHQSLGQGKFLKGIPPNRDTELKIRQIIEKIRYGEQHKSNMKVFSNMSEEEAKRIVLYLLENLKVRN